MLSLRMVNVVFNSDNMVATIPEFDGEFTVSLMSFSAACSEMKADLAP